MIKLNKLKKRTSPPLSDCSILGIMLVASIHSSDLPTSSKVFSLQGIHIAKFAEMIDYPEDIVVAIEVRHFN